MGDWSHENERETPYIYESPDGKTVTRRLFAADVMDREIIYENGKKVKPKPFYQWQIKSNKNE